MNNKTIIEFGYRMIWNIMMISEGVILLGHTLLDLHNSSDDTQPHSIIANYFNAWLQSSLIIELPQITSGYCM